MNTILTKLMMPELYPFVEEVLKHGKVGISGGNIRAVDVQTGAFTLHNGPCADRLKLVIPYGGQSVTWELVFFGNSARFPPDFLFDDKSFIPDIKSVKGLYNWSRDDKKSLLRLVQEFVRFYRQHQVSLLEGYSRLQFEYSTLIQQNGFSDDDVEVQLDKRVKNGPVKFLIKLPCEFSSIPGLSGLDNISEDSALLLMTFQSPNGSKVTPQLNLSPRVEEALRGLWRLPPYPNGGCLMDYVPSICKLLQGKVDQIVNGFQKRKEYFEAFLNRFGNFVLEYDVSGFEKLAFLFEWKNFHFILNIEIPRLFPEEKPRLTFQSVYHLTNDQPFTTSTHDYPYSPRWSANEMVDRTRTFMLDFIPQFQKTSIQNIK